LKQELTEHGTYLETPLRDNMSDERPKSFIKWLTSTRRLIETVICYYCAYLLARHMRRRGRGLGPGLERKKSHMALHVKPTRRGVSRHRHYRIKELFNGDCRGAGPFDGVWGRAPRKRAEGEFCRNEKFTHDRNFF
ncbi:MAG: hypothetical protein WB791_01225, partial [Waddliaceae bacterium]